MNEPLSSNEQCEHRTPDGGWTPWHFDQCPRCQIERLQALLRSIAEHPNAKFNVSAAEDERLPTIREMVWTRRATLCGADEAPPAKDEVLEAIRAGRVTYPPEVLPTGRWMSAEETTGTRQGSSVALSVSGGDPAGESREKRPTDNRHRVAGERAEQPVFNGEVAGSSPAPAARPSEEATKSPWCADGNDGMTCRLLRGHDGSHSAWINGLQVYWASEKTSDG